MPDIPPVMEEVYVDISLLYFCASNYMRFSYIVINAQSLYFVYKPQNRFIFFMPCTCSWKHESRCVKNGLFSSQVNKCLYEIYFI